jgi:hypothetical protein
MAVPTAFLVNGFAPVSLAIFGFSGPLARRHPIVLCADITANLPSALCNIMDGILSRYREQLYGRA